MKAMYVLNNYQKGADLKRVGLDRVIWQYKLDRYHTCFVLELARKGISNGCSEVSTKEFADKVFHKDGYEVDGLSEFGFEQFMKQKFPAYFN